LSFLKFKIVECTGGYVLGVLFDGNESKILV